MNDVEFELTTFTSIDTNGNTVHMKHAASLDQINGKYHVVTTSDETILRHEVFDNRPLLHNGEYEHARASILGKTVSFTPLSYRPSAYPEYNITDILTYYFDNGHEVKTWAICKVDNCTAHVFYENNHTDGRLVHQLVDLSLKSISSRIKQKLQEDYKLHPEQHVFFAKDRNLTYIPF